MASMREIRRRRETIQSTEQITKAMKLSATVKLKRARQQVEAVRPYTTMMEQVLRSAVKSPGGDGNRYCAAGASEKKIVVAVTSNRGLAGGYNNNIVKLIAGSLDAQTTSVYAIGQKGREALSKKGYEIGCDRSVIMTDPTYPAAKELAALLLEAFLRGEAGTIYLAYTTFQNTVTHQPTLQKLLPVEPETWEGGGMTIPMNFEPDEEEVLTAMVPKYLTALLYGALLEATASEHGARMTAMEAASNNAADMTLELELQYNRARQGAITQELTEIIAGANAIGIL